MLMGCEYSMMLIKFLHVHIVFGLCHLHFKIDLKHLTIFKHFGLTNLCTMTYL